MAHVRLRMRGRRWWASAMACALVASIAVVIGPASPAAAASQPLTLGFDKKVYGDFILSGNSVLVCPAGNVQCLAGANDTTSSNSNANDSFSMTTTGADTANGIFDSSTVQFTIPSGATVAYAQLMWSGSTGLYGTNTPSTCGTQGSASRPTGMPAAATPSNTPVRLTVGANNPVSVTGSRLTTDTATANQQQFYSGSADVTSAFANAPSGSPLTVKAANVFAYQGFGCMGGWSIAVVWDFGQPNATFAPSQKEVFVYDGHLRVASGAPATATITGFRANGAARVGMVAYEGDNALTGDFFSINGVNQPEPRTGKTTNFFISNAANELSPNSRTTTRSTPRRSTYRQR